MNPDPLQVPDEEEPRSGWADDDPFRRTRARDIALLCFGGLVIIAILAWLR
jgi:hypothetical protein